MASESAPVDPLSFLKSSDIRSIDKIYNILIPSLVNQIAIAKQSIKRENDNSNNNNQNSSAISQDEESVIRSQTRLCGQLEMLRGDLDDIKKSFKDLAKFEGTIDDPFRAVILNVDNIAKEITENPAACCSSESIAQISIRNLNAIFHKLKVKVPPADRNANQDGQSDNRIPNISVSLPVFYLGKEFEEGEVFKEYKMLYQELDRTTKLCLLCFALFPESEVIKKRVLMYWWIGEGLIIEQSNGGGETAEDAVNRIIRELVSKGFLVPVKEKRKLAGSSFNMYPIVRSAVSVIAKKELFFDFDEKGSLSWKFKLSSRACLTESGCSIRLSDPNSGLEQEKLRTLFNVNENYLKFNPEWFLKLRNICVLQLGRWQSSQKHHIEVDDTEFLKKFKYMKHLKFFSLQGISRITELPKSIFRSLSNLAILDLRACHSLEILPDEIGVLKFLIYLDVSECHLLDEVPKSLSSLLQLEVLKGFVMGDPKSKTACTLEDLANLKSLRKLSISTGWYDFPVERHLAALQQLQGLRNLAIAWGAKRDNEDKKEDGEMKSSELGTPKAATEQGKKPQRMLSKMMTFKRTKSSLDQVFLPTELKKLDLQCFPRAAPPDWLMPKQLPKLEKLYIMGGKLSSIGQVYSGDTNSWKVKILRLNYLRDMKMDWIELQMLFPDLVYLENVRCPNLALFPCDVNGVWQKEE